MSGLLLIKWSWPSIFWFLSIASSTIFLATLLFLPETCRQVVGNGSRRGPPINRTIAPLLSPKNSVLEDVGSLTTREKRELDGIKAANPFSTLTLLKCRSTALAIACYSIYYTIYSCLQASLSTIFVETYKVTGLIAGLSYIPFGVACVLASSVAGMLALRPCFMYHLRVNQRYTPPGKMLDFDYRRTAVHWASGLTAVKQVICRPFRLSGHGFEPASTPSCCARRSSWHTGGFSRREL
jgi:hypothetical protein